MIRDSRLKKIIHHPSVRKLERSSRKKGPRPHCFKTKGTGTFFPAFSFCWMICFASLGARAGVKLPLDGYTRPGRFFPIMLDGREADRSIVFSGDGCMDCQLQPGFATTRIVPMLAIGSTRELKWDGGAAPLRVVGDRERLVGTSDAELDKTLFPDDREIPIRLDPADLLPGPAVAWESLDALLLDSAMFQRITDAQRSDLLAGGVMLAARGEVPDQRWPWRFNGSLWILSPIRARLNGQLIDENVYAPTFGWTPGWAPQIRGRVVGLAALLVLFTAGILTVRKNWITAAAAIGLSLLAAGGVAGWHHSLSNIDRAGGDIIIADRGLVQRDSWVYQRAKRSSTEAVPWAGSTHPVFASTVGLTLSRMQLHIGADDELTFVYQAIASRTVAFVRTQIEPGAMPATVNSKQSPMQEAARLVYLSPGLRVVGELPGLDGRWSGVVLTR
jgi:hypothetical protein